MGLKWWRFIKNDNDSEVARIRVVFDETRIKLRVINVRTQWVHYEVLGDSYNFFWTIVYGLYDRSSRKKLWGFIDKNFIQEKPWIVQGHFNIVLRSEFKKEGGSYMSMQLKILIIVF